MTALGGAPLSVVIVGCGRVGAVVAENLDALGNDVLVIDTNPRAFDRLPPTFRGRAIRGDGTDEDVLRRAGAENADLFLALTEGDNRNIISTQLAAEVLGARRVIAKINDPVRATAYADLGIATLCRTNLMADAISAYLGLPRAYPAGVQAPTGHHPGGEHHEPPGPVGSGGGVASGSIGSGAVRGREEA
ncbi:MAG TPA: TrkA family potassium uptake protein [Candidatus Limnocylindrales bacterium]|nr:TrkA family potassium uptake protein [Candidatus Limnocylindrales bacterium]